MNPTMPSTQSPETASASIPQLTNVGGNPLQFLPTAHRLRPPTKKVAEEDGRDVHLWYIVEDEYRRLCHLFGRDFQETGVGGTRVVGEPAACTGCGKYTEFIDWVWTAVKRGVHSPAFMFKALKDGRTGQENAHDVYCSECGTLTVVRSRNNAEGGAPTIFLAAPIKRSDYPFAPRMPERKSSNAPSVVWGQWWLDNTGSAARYIQMQRAKKQEEERTRNLETTISLGA